MARGSKKSYTGKQKRRAKHIEDSAKKSGKSSKTAARIAYATINKEEGGGKKSGSGRGKKPNRSASRKGGKKGGRKAGARKKK
jgi:hypothetical protein